MEEYDLNLSPSLLVIGSREHTLQKLNSMNIRYRLIQAIDDPLSDYVDKRIVFINSYEQLEKIGRIAKQLHQEHNFTAVVSFTEFGLYPAALIAKQLNIRGNALFPVEHTRNKLNMRLLLQKHKFDSILYQNCRTIEEVIAFYKKIGGPIILKPIDGAGSLGVYYVDSSKQIAKAWDWANQRSKQQLIAEEYFLGQEYSVESLSFNGKHQIIGITEKQTTGFPHFIELSHRAPALISQELTQKIQQLILRFLHIIEQQNGPAHTEIKVHGEEIKIIESQTRMGGDQIWELTELTTGKDVIAETVLYLLGLKPKSDNKKANAAAILFFAREFEEVLEINGLESARKLPGIVRILCNLEKGLKLGKLISSQSRQGYILGIGNHLDEAVARVQLAMNHLQIKTRNVAPTIKVDITCQNQ